MALKVVLALAVVALAAADDGYVINAPARFFSHGAPIRAVESSEEDDGYNYQEPARTFTHRAPVRIAKTYVAPVQPKKTYVAPVRIAKTYVAPVQPKKTYVAPAKPVAKYVAPVRAVESSEEDDAYKYEQPARTFTHRAPVRVAKTYVAPAKPKNVYVAPAKPKSIYVAPTAAPAPVKTYKAPAKTYKAPESEEVLDYVPTNPEYNQRYAVSDDETGAEFHHEEERDGDQTSGSYSVNLPDGRVQTVTYYVNGEGGFVADVTYEGEAQYPEEPEGGYGPWTGPIAAPNVVKGEYSAPRRTVVPVDSSEEIQTPRGLYNTPRA